MSEDPFVDDRSLIEAAECRRQDPEFERRLRMIIEEDQELLRRLAG